MKRKSIHIALLAALVGFSVGAAALAATNKHRPFPDLPEEFDGTKDGGGKEVHSTRVSQQEILQAAVDAKASILQGFNEAAYSIREREKLLASPDRRNYGPINPITAEEKYFLKHIRSFRDTADKISILALTDDDCLDSEKHKKDGGSATGRPNEICISLKNLQQKESQGSYAYTVRELIAHELTHRLAGKNERMAESAERFVANENFTSNVRIFTGSDLDEVLRAEIPRVRKALVSEGRAGPHGLYWAALALGHFLKDARRLFDTAHSYPAPPEEAGTYFPFPLAELRNEAYAIAKGIKLKACSEIGQVSTFVMNEEYLPAMKEKCAKEYKALLAGGKVEEINSDADYERELKKFEGLLAKMKAEGDRILSQKYEVRVRAKLNPTEETTEAEPDAEGSAQ